MNPDATARERIRALIDSNVVLLFMKGSREAPRCGFSATVVQILDQLIPDYHTVDVLADEKLREDIKEYSSWPTIPQLYVRGEFVGGCDIVKESFASGDLHQKLGVAQVEADSPTISISDDATAELHKATAQAPAEFVLRLAIDARYRSRMLLEPEDADDVVVEANGVRLCMDRLSASRACDAHIDLVRSSGGNAFRVGLPHAPTPSHD